MIQALSALNVLVGSFFGLLVGSFLNVVICRLPKMIGADLADDVAGRERTKSERFNLMVPRSACPSCGHKIKAIENVPVISYLLLGGRCSGCRVPISMRYPAVEIGLAVAAGICTAKFGLTPTALAWSLFCAALIALAMINWDTRLLPDVIIHPLLWLGLVASIMRWTPVGIEHSVLGAMGGYVFLWGMCWALKQLIGEEVIGKHIGEGDFKLFAALGAWFGWQGLAPLILLSFLAALVIGVVMKINSVQRDGGRAPFGVFLAGAGFIGMYMGPFGLRSLTLG